MNVWDKKIPKFTRGKMAYRIGKYGSKVLFPNNVKTLSWSLTLRMWKVFYKAKLFCDIFRGKRGVQHYLLSGLFSSFLLAFALNIAWCRTLGNLTRIGFFNMNIITPWYFLQMYKKASIVFYGAMRL